MYNEIQEFVKSVGCDPRLFKDGEFWTAILVAIGMGFGIYCDPTLVIRMRAHFGDLLTVTSIVFGFVLSALFFYIQATGTWSKSDEVQKVAESIIDHHVWTLVSFLLLIGYIVFLWAFGTEAILGKHFSTLAYSILVFLTSYCGFQVLNQILTVRWAFRNRNKLTPGDPGQ